MRQVNIHILPLIRRSHFIVRFPVASAGAALVWSTTDAVTASHCAVHRMPRRTAVPVSVKGCGV
jgi:hypothetical protein